MRVLVVDDDALVRDVTRRLIERLGYDALTAASAAEAIAIFEKERVDLAILDLRLPDLSGAVCFDALRAMDPNLSVIVASGYGRDETVQALIERGAADFLRKPYRLEELERVLRAQLTSRDG